MRLGPLRHRVTIQYEERNEDSAGGFVPIWRDLDVVYMFKRTD